MPNESYRIWLDDGSVTSFRVPDALAILVRQARAQQPITYGDLSRQLAMSHHRPVRFVAGYVGFTLKSLGDHPAWRSRRPPPLQSLVINAGTKMPGPGVDGFMGRAYQAAVTKVQKRAALLGHYAEIYSYPYWEEVLTSLNISNAHVSFDSIITQAIKSSGRGGEGPEHLALKERVAANPGLVGLPRIHPIGSIEFGLASGDRIDVVFEGQTSKTAVEVKSSISSDADITRGLFQCLKYRVVLEAQSALSEKPYDVDVILAVGKPFPEALRPIQVSLGIKVVDRL